MTRSFLEQMNGGSNGAFRFWLNDIIPEPRIAWYPSAGEDFKDLLYLSSRFSNLNRGEKEDPRPPDIFLHTDYFPYRSSKFLDKKNFMIDERTKARIKAIEELPPCYMPLDPRLVMFSKGGQATDRVIFLDIEIESRVLGKFTAPVLYVFSENTAFCCERAIPAGAKFSHIVHVRYGGGCGGGGHASGAWMLNVLRKLDCEVFITDGHLNIQSGDRRAFDLYPEFAGNGETPLLRPFRILPGQKWSSHGDISWNFVNQARPLDSAEA